ncbi:MAG: phosphopyruvate hydratase [Jatrophihabitantaceae bacterium]
MSVTVSSMHAIEVLDSRGRPTLDVQVKLAGGASAHAGVPSGASTGSGEAVELRDGDPARYGGLGVLTAVGNVNGEIAQTLCGRIFGHPSDLDVALLELDGTQSKSKLGANAIIGVSMAVARAHAISIGQPLWRALQPHDVAARLPVPHFNVVNGGAHARNELDFQEFMIAPVGAPTLPDAIRAGADVYGRLRALLSERGLATGLGDEGGFAPELNRPEDVLRVLVQAIEEAGYRVEPAGVMIALDPAASEFCYDGAYRVAGEKLSSAEMVSYYEQLASDFPIWSLEDGMDESDDDGWLRLTEALGHRLQLVGDDNFVTDPRRIEDAAARGVANASLIKLNQIGSVSETLEALAVCRRVGFAAMISHRSGETEDSFIADLAVGSGCGQLKSGAPARGERVAKYNRLIAIAQEDPNLPYGLPAGSIRSR